jgi:endonuclease/exonuclease/phosphatase family metal-dependent hydrolase
MRAFNVMTFNLRGSMFEIDGDNYWPHRADLNLRVIRQANPDLIGFQEYQSGNQASYDTGLTDYAYEQGPVTIDDSEFGMYNPIYWRRDRFHRRDGGAFYLSPTPDTWSYGWDTSLVRAATWVRLHDTTTHQDLIALNVHLDHLGEQARVEGARLVVRRLQALRDGLPVVITGDFNSRVWAIEDAGGVFPPGLEEEATPAGTVHQVFTHAGYQDTFLAVGHTDSPASNTFHNFQGIAYPAIGQRIDWVLVDGFTPTDCTIIRTGEPPVFPSDHYPVMATLA